MSDTQPDRRPRAVAVLAAIAILGVALALFALHRESNEGAAAYRPQTALPGFAAHVNQAARIHILTKSSDFDVAFVPEKGWVVATRDNYPANFQTVRSLLVGLAGLETIEPKTARADWLSYVDLDAPPKGAGTSISVSDDKGHVVAALITGKAESIGDNTGALGLFIRHPGDDQSYLARSVLVPKTTISDWLDKTVMDIETARIRAVDVDPPDSASYEVRRDKPSDTNFLLDPVPKGRQLSDPSATSVIGEAVVAFTFDDVRRASELDFSKPWRIVTKTFDGLGITENAIHDKDGAAWVTVAAATLPGTNGAAKEADTINSHASGWAYKLSAADAQRLFVTRDSMLNPPPGAKGADTVPAMP